MYHYVVPSRYGSHLTFLTLPNASFLLVQSVRGIRELDQFSFVLITRMVNLVYVCVRSLARARMCHLAFS